MNLTSGFTELQRMASSIWRGTRLLFARELAIDLGAANTRIFVPGRGVMVNEPSVVALRELDRQVVAIGREAKPLIGRVPPSINVLHPLKDGVVADVEAAAKMLSIFIRRAGAQRSLFGPQIVMCVPAEITQLERRAVEEVARRAGGHQVRLIEEPLAAAAGAGIDTRAVHAAAIVDIGAETVNVAVLSLGGLVCSSTWRTGGTAMDNAILRYLREKHNLEVGEETAEAIKRTLGSVAPHQSDGVFEAEGRSLITRLPARVSVNSAEIQAVLTPVMDEIIGDVASALEELPPEVSADLLESGVVLTGGGAQLPGLPERLSHKIGLEVRLSNLPTLVAVIGAARLFWPEAADSTPGATTTPKATGATATTDYAHPPI